jgi:hypothetical protein
MNAKSNDRILRRLPLVIFFLIIVPFTVRAAGHDGRPGEASPPGASISGSGKDGTDATTTEEALYLKVHFDTAPKTSALKPGVIIEGVLAEPAYSGSREAIPSGSRIHLTVEKLDRVRKAPSAHWPWMIKVFAPRHQYQPVFSLASAVLGDGREIPLKVSLISLSEKKDVRVEWRTDKPAPSSTERAEISPAPVSESRQAHWTKAGTRPDHAAGATATFEAVELADSNHESAGPGGAPGPEGLPDIVTIDAGTEARVILLGPISASRSRAGDVITARLVEPVRIGSKLVLPEGCLVEGKVVKVTPPRWLSRSGSLLLTFDRLKFPGGVSVPIAASLAGAQLDATSQAKIDPEGNISANPPGRAWMLINLGTSLGISKVVDDGTQLLIQLIVSTATDASTAGVARIASACISGVFMITRHGRDVVLPKYTEIRIVLDGPITLTAPPSGSELRDSIFSNSPHLPSALPPRVAVSH